MNCTEAREMFSVMYDGKADADETARFEAHMHDCPECAADYESFRATMAAIHTLPEPLPPEGFHEMLMRRIRALRPAKTHAPFRLYAHAAGWTAACFILLAAVMACISGGLESVGTSTGGNKAFEAAINADKTTATTAEAEMDAGVSSLSAATANPYARAVVGNDIAVTLAAGYFEQNFNIDIIVEDMDAAAAVVENLNGYNLNADRRNYPDGGGYGSFRRRVDVAAYAGVKEALRTLGEVTNETENVTRYADDIYDLEAQMKAKELECERLSDLLSQSRTMDVLVSVENQLGMAESEREDLRGRLNQLYDITSRPYININLHVRPPEPVVLPDDTFAERLRDRFVHSMNAFIVFMENLVVFLSGVFVPLSVTIVFALMAFALYKQRARRDGNPETDTNKEARDE